MSKLLKATHEGKLKIGELELNCAVLEDGTRIISRNAIFKAFGRTKRGRSIGEVRVPNMPSFIDAKNLQPFIGEDLMGVLNQIDYIDKNKKNDSGYNALILPMLCKVYLDARQDKSLKTQQQPLARASEILLLGLSKIGIIALVDEATGYQIEFLCFNSGSSIASIIEFTDRQIKDGTINTNYYKEFIVGNSSIYACHPYYKHSDYNKWCAMPNTPKNRKLAEELNEKMRGAQLVNDINP